MKLEEGMHIRTKWGIAKIKTLDDLDNVAWTDVKDIFFGVYRPKGKVNFVLYDDGTVLKASHNIIDLIEVGDYVNGYPVYETIEYPDNTRAIVIADDNKSIIWEESSQYIKSIVTKEQYESMKYEVK